MHDPFNLWPGYKSIRQTKLYRRILMRKQIGLLSTVSTVVLSSLVSASAFGDGNKTPYTPDCRQAAKDSVISCTGAGMAVGSCAATLNPGACIVAIPTAATCANDLSKARTSCEPAKPSSGTSQRSGTAGVAR
jgi:hypothetical protein